MVYGLNEIAISKEAQENIDIGRLYYDIMNEDYSLLGGGLNEYLAEAVDFKKLKDTIKEKLKVAVGKVLELIDKLKKKVMGTLSYIFEKLKQKGIGALQKAASKKSTITIPETANLMKPNTKQNPIEKASAKASDIKKTIRSMIAEFDKTIKNFADYDNNNYSADERYADAKSLLSDTFDDRIESIAKNIKILNLNDIFFETSKPGQFTITGQEVSKLIGYATTKDLSSKVQNEFDSIEEEMKFTSKQVESTINNYYRLYGPDNVSQNGEFIKRMSNLFEQYCYNLIKSSCNACSALSMRLGNGCIQYISTINQIVRLAFNSKELQELTNQK